jgi:hypothetical protein
MLNQNESQNRKQIQDVMCHKNKFEDIHTNESRLNRVRMYYSLHNQNPYEIEENNCRWVMEHMPKTYSEEEKKQTIISMVI